MKRHIPNMVWLGLAMAVGYWLIESMMHTFIYGDGPLAFTLMAEHDLNEFWMRVIIVILFVAFGWIANRAVRAERQLQKDAQRLARLLRFVETIKLGAQIPTNEHRSPQVPEQMPPPVSSAAGANSGGPADSPGDIGELVFRKDDMGELTRFLQQISEFLNLRFREPFALLELTRDINMGLLLDDILEKAYERLRSVLPYNRLCLALLEENDTVARIRWVRADYPDLMLRMGYCASLQGSSLQEIILSGEPRIINDLTAYLKAHPNSESTRLMVAEGGRSSLTCPLISLGRPIGFMFFSSRSPDAYKSVHVVIFKLIAGHLSVVVEKSDLYQRILKEKERSESLLLNVMPERIASRLSAGEKQVSEYLPEINVFFADIVGFTEFAFRSSPEQVLNVLQNLFVPLDRLCDLHGVEKIKTIGDEFMAISRPLSTNDNGHLRNLAEFALDALKLVEGMRYPDGQLLRIRIGMHTGPGVAGVIGQRKFAYDIWGDTVNIAHRMESTGEAGRIHVSQEIHSRLHEHFSFEEREELEVKGIGRMKTYFLTAEKSSP
ncbi:MAG: GAF domain-containing protein [Betaproteobacteria bacterium]|nr:GAF domain-containing protein [Betaproteobacteria bacterium]